MGHLSRTRRVPLNRALSRLGLLSRAQATAAILAARVRVDGRVVVDPSMLVVPERTRVAIDDEPQPQAEWRTVAFHKPRGVVTTRRDPEGRPTIFDVLGPRAHGLIAVGRLDMATSGLLLLTNDTRMAAWITDSVNAIRRTYVVTVRGRVTSELLAAANSRLDEFDRLVIERDPAVRIRKASNRETHLVVELREGRNRQVRRLFERLGREVTRLKRVAFGGVQLGTLRPGESRAVRAEELRQAFPGIPIRRQGKTRMA
jgi:23S rRNA pseudouridine2605 synthase